MARPFAFVAQILSAYLLFFLFRYFFYIVLDYECLIANMSMFIKQISVETNRQHKPIHKL